MNNPNANARRIKSRPDPLNLYVNSEICTSECEVEANTSAATEKSSFSLMRLGAVDVLRCEGFGLRWTKRGYHHIRADRGDDILIAVPLIANSIVSQSGNIAHVGAGEFVCLSTAKPFSVCTSGPRPDSSFSVYLVRIPAALLRQYVPLIDNCCSRSVAIRPGAGKIMLSLFEQALAQGASLSSSQSQRFGTMLIDAVASTTQEAPELQPSLTQSRESSQQRVLRQAKKYIECNFSDSALTSAEIAHYCKVSVRYLNAAFSAHSTTVGAYLRECRLTQCRLELMSPALRDKSIAEISMRWGFNDAAYFSRAYKDKFGQAPSVERKAGIRRARHN